MSTRNTLFPRLAGLTLVLAGVLAGAGPADNARRWTNAKFLAQADAGVAPAHLLVQLRSGTLERNRIKDRAFSIAGTKYERGVAMPSPGEVSVILPAPAARFEAVAGVDGNDLGYYSNGGRGSVVATVETDGQELFRSPVLHEGLKGVPVAVELHGAREFKLKLEAVGQHGLTWQGEWDQADWAEARVTLQDGTRLWLADLQQGPLAGAYTTAAPFLFRYDGRESAEFLKDWPIERTTRPLGPNRSEHVATYTDPQTGLVVRAVAVEYSDFPVVEWTVYLKNTSAVPTPIIENLQALDTQFERGGQGEFVLHHSTGSPYSPTDFQPLTTVLGAGQSQRLASVGGRPTDGPMCYFNLEWPGQGIIIGLGWPGQWAAQFARDKQRGVRVTAGQELTHFRLLAGEEVRTPLVALQFWEGDWTAAQNVWRRWMIADNLPRPGGRLPPPQIAGGTGRETIEMQDATEENQLDYLARMLKTGVKIDYWWMDAGWYAFQKGWWNTGTWDPDPGRFPHGFTPISAAAHQGGVKTIVWFEPERVTKGSWLWEQHPEWLIGQEDHDKLLFLGNPQARQWLTEHVSKIIAQQGIDLYRQDFNFEPLGLWRAHDAVDRQGITEMQHVMGYLAYWDELRRRFPKMLIDTCASGGRRLDLETLRRAVPLWRSDFAYVPASMQQFTYGLAMWVPYFGTGFNSLDPYIFWSQMTPAVGIGLDVERVETDSARIQRLLGQWREVAQLYYGDYYPLTPYSTEQSAWLAWQFDSPVEKRGMVQAFRRPESPFETAQFRLRGLDPSSRYAVRDLDSQKETWHTGREMMDPGLAVTIRERPGVVNLVYRQVE
ncbi:MAG: alpha-galactosidase [Bryobacteraceae bacterium]